MTFSFSAPRFTKADERREQENLTEQERLEAWSDVYGETGPIHETAEQTVMASVQVERELQRIPTASKQAYLEAMSVCPEVVRLESSPLRFMRREKYDAERAAKRLVKYWDMRKLVFGDKAFLPMTLKGGCLTEQDVHSLSLGHFSLLPPDKFGRTVLYETRGHLDDHGIDYASLLRAQWYMLHVALEEESTQTNGIVIVSNNRGILPNHFSRKHEKLLWSSICACLPVHIRAIHCCYPKSYMDLFLPQLKNIYGRHLRLRHVVHDDGSESEALYSLKQYGFEEKGLPPAFLGCYRLDPVGWVNERLTVEGSRPRLCHCHRKRKERSDSIELDMCSLEEEEVEHGDRQVSPSSGCPMAIVG